MTRILVIEDEDRTASEIVAALNEAGMFASHSGNGSKGLELALEGDFDAITLDRLLPGLDGLDVLRKLRERGNSTPVLVVSALGEIDDRVRGLRAGGDDYLVKPFALVELVARVEALIRRPRSEGTETILQAGPIRMDLLNRRVTRDGRVIDVTQREFSLLEYFLRNAGQRLTRSMLYEAVWDYKFDPGTNLIDVHIGRLRRKVDAEGEAPTIVTVRGSGWKFDATG